MVCDSSPSSVAYSPLQRASSRIDVPDSSVGGRPERGMQRAAFEDEWCVFDCSEMLRLWD